MSIGVSHYYTHYYSILLTTPHYSSLLLTSHYSPLLNSTHYSSVSTDLLQQVDGVPAADHLGAEGGGGGGAPVLLNLLQEVGHRHALRHGAPQPGTGPGPDRDTTGTGPGHDRHRTGTRPGHDRDRSHRSWQINTPTQKTEETRRGSIVINNKIMLI